MHRNIDMSEKKRVQGGYVALMATIIISVILLVMTVEEGALGWNARFNILGTEAKEQAYALAEGCVDQALAAIVTDPSYQGNATITSTGGTCRVFPMQFDTPAAGFLTVKTQGEVRNAFVTLKIVVDTNDMYFGTPVPISWREIPNAE